MQSEASVEESHDTSLEVETSQGPSPVILKKITPGNEMGMVQITESPEAIAKKFDNFEKLRSLILKDDDFYELKSKDKTKTVGYGVGKTGLYKLGVAFNLDTLIVLEKKITKQEQPDYIAYKITMQCTAPNGRLCMDVGFADNTARDLGEEVSEHIVRAMATTRARERCYTVMTGETGKKGKDFKSSKPEPTFCICKDGPKTKMDGTCKDCGAVSKQYYESHRDQFK